MFKIFKKNELNSDEKDKILSKIGSLLIHAAKIDENYVCYTSPLYIPFLIHALRSFYTYLKINYIGKQRS